jgi:hypothetical protein
MEAPPSGIPTHLFNALLMLKGTLEERGTIQLRRDHKRPSYRLRVRAYAGESYRRHIAIPIPDEAVPAVKKLLSQWRTEYQATRAVKQAKIDQEKARKRQEKLEAKEERQALRLMIGGTDWRQRRLLREWDQMNKLGPVQATLWLASTQYARSNPRKTSRDKRDREAEMKRLGLFQTVDVQRVVREMVIERRSRLGLILCAGDGVRANMVRIDVATGAAFH